MKIPTYLEDQYVKEVLYNTSLEDFPGEQWKPLKGLEKQFAISNKGRIKRLNSWTQATGKTFLKEHIVSLLLDVQPKK